MNVFVERARQAARENLAREQARLDELHRLHLRDREMLDLAAEALVPFVGHPLRNGPLEGIKLRRSGGSGEPGSEFVELRPDGEDLVTVGIYRDSSNGAAYQVGGSAGASGTHPDVDMLMTAIVAALGRVIDPDASEEEVSMRAALGGLEVGPGGLRVSAVKALLDYLKAHHRPLPREDDDPEIPF